MSTDNNKDSDVAVVIGFVGAICAILMMFVFALLAFVAFILTILAVIAWHRPLTIGKWTLEPVEARTFVYRGLAGSMLVPIFVFFCAVLFETPINPDAWSFFVLGGYVLGSIGVEILMADQSQSQQSPVVSVYTPPIEHLPPQRSAQPPSLPAPPFRYASWDDEEGRQ